MTICGCIGVSIYMSIYLRRKEANEEVEDVNTQAIGHNEPPIQVVHTNEVQSNKQHEEYPSLHPEGLGLVHQILPFLVR